MTEPAKIACPECGDTDHIYALEGPELRFSPVSGLWTLTNPGSDRCECTECDAQFLASDIGLPAPDVPEPEKGAASDGPYRVELAEAFRKGARRMGEAALSDKIEVPADAEVRECAGDGVLVACWLYVHDIERAPLAGEMEG